MYSNSANLKTVFILRREPLYHKLQYSKTPKFDAAAATLGAGFGALSVYLGLAGFGSMGADLTDLTVLGWYIILWALILISQLNLFRSLTTLETSSSIIYSLPTEIFLAIVKELGLVLKNIRVFLRCFIMFRPRRFSPTSTQKRRETRFNSVSTIFPNWPGLISLGSGLLAASVVDRLAILAKRASGVGLSGRSFWINIQVSGIISQKPEKVRMGKGKGGYKGLIARVRRGSSLVLFSAIRRGSLKKLERWLRARVNFAIRSHNCSRGLVFNQETGFFGSVDWRKNRNSQKNYITGRLDEFKEQLQRLRRPFLWSYFGKIFYWRLVTPVAVWTLPKDIKRKRFRLRLGKLRRLKIHLELSSQNFSFIRQIKFHYKVSWTNYVLSKKKSWKRRQLIWAQVLQDGSRLSPLAQNSWDILLKMPSRSSLIPTINWSALINPLDKTAMSFPKDRVITSLDLSALPKINFRLNLLRQLTLSAVYFYWIARITHPITRILNRLLSSNDLSLFTRG